MADLGKLLVVVGLVITGLGMALWLGIGRGWLGRLPGDLQIERGNVSIYVPIATCLLISVVLTLLLKLFWR